MTSLPDLFFTADDPSLARPPNPRDTARAMSEENVEIVMAFGEAAMRQDWTRAAELVDPGIELHGTVGGVAEGRVYRGLAEVRREYDDVDGEAWEERRIEPEGFLDAGDDVVVLLHEFRRGRGSGVELEIDGGGSRPATDGWRPWAANESWLSCV